MLRKAFCVLVAVLLVGCAGIKFSEDTSYFKLGKMTGAYVAVENPEFITTALPYAEGLLKVAKSGEITDSQILTALDALDIKYFTDKKWTVISAAILSDIDIKIETGKVNQQVVDFLEGFIFGLKLGV